MDTDLLTSDNIYDAESGHFISAHHQRLAEIVADYNPDLRVVWIPPSERVAGGPKPFGVAHFPPGREPYVIMVLSETDMDHPTRILEMLIQADQGRGSGNSPLARIEAAAAAATLLREKEQADAMAERHDRALSMFRSNNSRYQLGRGRTVDLSA